MITTTRVTPAGPPPEFVPKPPSDTGVERPSPNDPEEQKVAAELRTRFTEWESADSEFLQNVKLELDFLSGKHWIDPTTGMDKSIEMAAKGRSAFTIDLLQPSVDLVVNQIRINKITANFVPIGEGADEATAEVRQGLYRNIDRVSKAAIARETGYQLAVSVGRGYWRVVIQDEEGPSFAQRIAIIRVDNLNSIAIDPTCLDFTYADAGWAYAFDDLSKDEFRATYGITDDRPLDVTGMLVPGLTDNQRAVWFPKDKVRVGEYYRKVWKAREVWKLADGTVCWKEDAPAGARPIKIKKKPDYVIEWRKMTGTQTIEKRIWPGRHIPIVVCVGREVFRGSKPKIHSGLVKPAIDPSRIHDYMESRTVDEVALSPLPHLFSPEGSLSPEQEKIVNQINSFPWSVVTYTPKQDEQGRQLPPPMWASPAPNTGAIVQSAQSAKDNLQRVLNTYAPQLGRQQGDQSGRAIREVKDAGDISHAAFPDNYNRAIDREAEIVNDLMDVVYTEAQAVTITQIDEKTKQVLINQEYTDEKTGKVRKHLFGSGKYAVATTSGPSYPSAQRQGVQQILDLAVKFPQLGQALDLIIQDIGIPTWRRYAERVRPPGFKDDEDGPSVMQLMQHVQEMEQNAQQADALIQKLLQRVQELGNAETVKRLEIASKERIAAANNRTVLMAAEVKAGTEAAHTVLMAELEAILKSLEVGDDTKAPTPEASPAPAAAPTVAAPTNGVPVPPSEPPVQQ